MTPLWLVIAEPSGALRTQPLEPGTHPVGREAAIRIAAANASRLHARLLRIGDAVFVEDAGSANGTRLNGVPLRQRVRFRPGDLVHVGDACLTLSERPDGADGPGIQITLLGRSDPPFAVVMPLRLRVVPQHEGPAASVHVWRQEERVAVACEADTAPVPGFTGRQSRVFDPGTPLVLPPFSLRLELVTAGASRQARSLSGPSAFLIVMPQGDWLTSKA